MKGENRAMTDPAPSDFNRDPIVSRICARVGCESTVKEDRKFCSSECFGISRRKQAERGPIPVALLDEMQAALDRLRDHIEEVTS